MSDIVGLVLIALVILCGLAGLAHISKPYKITNEEFEQRARDAPGLLSAGVMGLQKILDPAADKAMQVQQDFKQGYYNGEQESGEDHEPGSNRSM